MGASRLESGLLGPVEARRDGERLELRAKQRALLCLLLLRPNEAVPADRLIDELWGGEPPPSAQSALQVHVRGLRRAFGDGSHEVLVTRQSGYSLALEPDQLDLHRFERLVEDGAAALADGYPEAAARTLRDALELWRGAPLADVAYEPFAQTPAARLEELRLAALARRVEADLACGRHAELVGELQALCAEHPQHEALAAHLMLALYRAGRQAEALETFQRTRRELVDELGIEPGPALRRLEREILVQDPSLELAAREAVPELPVPLSSFVGRTRELAELDSLLAREDVRLVTLTGPGGVGKTRLALEAGRAAADRHPDGSWFVDLSALRDPALVLPTVAQAVEAEDLVASLEGKRALLVLDNLEQVLDAAVDVAGLLRECPRLRVVVTSREPLRLTGEWNYPVPPHEAGEAEVLFRERALAAAGSVAGNGEVAELCRRLEGHALALELAAARTTMFTPARIVERLDHALAVLDQGPRDAPDRHRALRATIAWSYELLTAAERRLFRWLSVFVGGFTLAAAAQACEASEEALESLLEKSLLRTRDTELGSRLALLETIREFGAERLAESGELEEARGAHAAWLTELLREAEGAFDSPELAHWTQVVRAELDNARAALAHLHAGGDAEVQIRAVRSVAIYANHSGFFLAIVDLVEQALEREDASPESRLTVLRIGTGTAMEAGRPAVARERAERAAELAAELDDPARLAGALLNLAWVKAQDDDAASERVLVRALKVAAAAGDADLSASIEENLADSILQQGRIDEARERFGRVHDAFAELGNERMASWTRTSQGLVALASGRLDEAADHYRDAIERGRDVEAWRTVAVGIEGLGVVAAEQGRAVEAAQLLACAGVLGAETGAGAVTGQLERDLREQAEARIAAELDEAELEGLRVAGRCLSAAEALKLGRLSSSSPKGH